jgi:hypothetical protein
MPAYSGSFSWRQGSSTLTVAVTGCSSEEEVAFLLRRRALQAGYVAPRWWQIGRWLTEHRLPGKGGFAG